jgi:hypothetical protein
VEWFAWLRRAALLRACCAKWLERRAYRGELLHDVRSPHSGATRLEGDGAVAFGDERRRVLRASPSPIEVR